MNVQKGTKHYRLADQMSGVAPGYSNDKAMKIGASMMGELIQLLRYAAEIALQPTIAAYPQTGGDVR